MKRLIIVVVLFLILNEIKGQLSPTKVYTANWSGYYDIYKEKGKQILIKEEYNNYKINIYLNKAQYTISQNETIIFHGIILDIEDKPSYTTYVTTPFDYTGDYLLIIENNGAINFTGKEGEEYKYNTIYKNK